MVFYGAVGWNEPVSLGFILLGVSAVLKERKILLAAVIIAGTFNNKKIIMLILFSLVYLYKNGDWIFGFVLVGLYIIFQLFLRTEIGFPKIDPPGYSTHTSFYSWVPSREQVRYNLMGQWRNYPNAIVTFGIAGIGGLTYLLRGFARVVEESIPFRSRQDLLVQL